MSKFKKNLFFVLFLLAGILVGALLSDLCARVSFLKWLSYGCNVGISHGNPIVLDLSVIKLTFGLSVNITLVQILTIGLCMWLYTRSKWS